MNRNNLKYFSLNLININTESGLLEIPVAVAVNDIPAVQQLVSHRALHDPVTLTNVYLSEYMENIKFQRQGRNFGFVKEIISI